MKKAAMFAFVMFVFATVATRAETTWYQAMGSEGALRAYCLEQADSFDVGVGGDGVVSVGSELGFWVDFEKPVTTFEQLTAMMSGGTFELGVYDLNTMVSRQAYVANKEGWTLFFGNSWGYLKQTEVGYEVTGPAVTLDMPDFVPIRVPEGHAYIKIIHPDGSWEWVSIYTQNDGNGNMMMFPQTLAGKPGVLVLQPFDGGPAQVVNLSNGTLMPILAAKAELDVSFVGVMSAVNSVGAVIESQDGVGISPLFELKVTDSGKSIMIDVQTSEGERPTGFNLRMVNGSSEWIHYDMNGPMSVLMGLDAGTYQLDFEWSNFHSPNRQYQWYWGDRG